MPPWYTVQLNLYVAGVGHLTDAHSVLLSSLRPALWEVSSYFCAAAWSLCPLPPALHFLWLPLDTVMLQSWSFLLTVWLHSNDFGELLKTSGSSQDSCELQLLVLGGPPFKTCRLSSIHKSTPGSSNPLNDPLHRPPGPCRSWVSRDPSMTHFPAYL